MLLADEHPDQPQPEAPKTSGSARAFRWIAITILAIAGLIAGVMVVRIFVDAFQMSL